MRGTLHVDKLYIWNGLPGQRTLRCLLNQYRLRHWKSLRLWDLHNSMHIQQQLRESSCLPCKWRMRCMHTYWIRSCELKLVLCWRHADWRHLHMHLKF